jgi:hypothetical protein
MDKQHFTDMIKNSIEICSYNFFVVQQDFNNKCSCVDHNTKQPDESCKKCLGTGYKCTIRKCRGASNDELKGGATLSERSARIIKNYFIDDKFPIYDNNLIIDNNEIYYVYRVERMKGIYELNTHQEVTAVLLTNKHDVILNNFKNIINKKLTAEQRSEFDWLN